MASIVGGIGASHAPSMEHAFDAGAEVFGSAEWAPLFGPFAEAGRWLDELDPDCLVVIYNDHFNNFFLDTYPTFALGVADEFPIADEGFGARPFEPAAGRPDLAWHLARSLVADEFDIATCQEMEIDHGVISPLPMLDSSAAPNWRFPLVPLAVNVIVHPLPTARRCWRLGRAVARGIASFPEDLRVVVVGTGGLSHQLTGPHFGRVDEAWDREFLRTIAEDPERLADLTHGELIRRGGTESVEVVLWLAMRASLPAAAALDLEAYYPHRIMGYGLQTYTVPEEDP
jgi:protocatechuate 4,5-dioxygenase, beta chain